MVIARRCQFGVAPRVERTRGTGWPLPPVAAKAEAISERRLLQRQITCLAMTFFVFTFSQSAFALPPQAEKLKRGAFNAATGAAEVPKHMILETMNANPEWRASFHGIFYGSFKGAGLGAARILSGLYDVLTFPINYPDNFSSLISPDYFTFADID